MYRFRCEARILSVRGQRERVLSRTYAFVTPCCGFVAYRSWMQIDPTTAFGARALRRLSEDRLGWLVTVSPSGVPQPSRIWFLRDDDSILIYSKPATPKLRNIAANPNVALHLDGDSRGGDIVIVTGTAALSTDPPASAVDDYVAKYGELIAGNGWTLSSFAADYSVALRITPARLRGW